MTSTPRHSRSGAIAAPRRLPSLWGGFAEVARVIGVFLWTSVRYLVQKVLGRNTRRPFAMVLIQTLGPLYVKMAQILAAQSGLVSEGFRRGLQDVFDGNDAVPFTEIQALLKASFDCPLDTIFAEIRPEPIGVGSVAQVHAGRLLSGERVAIKVIKPNADRSLRHALNAAEIVVAVVTRTVARLRPLHLAENFATMREALLGQMDLAAERTGQERIARLFSDNPTIVVPRVHEALCTKTILVMDLIDGAPIYRLDEVDVDRPALARRMQEAFFSMIYQWGCFHVDPHPGNMLVLSDGRLALLDFGMTGELADVTRQMLRTFNSASVMRLWTQAADYFLEGMVIDAGQACADPAYRQRVSEVIRTHFDERRNRWSTAAFLGDMAPVLQSRGLRLRLDMALLALSLATAEGVLHLVDPNVDLWGNARRFVEQHV